MILEKQDIDRIGIVIPTLNEALTVAEILKGVKPYGSDIVVVDGHSTDKTAEIAESLGARVILDHQKGKGEAIRTVIPHLTREITVFIDADGSHDPTTFLLSSAPFSTAKRTMYPHRASSEAPASSMADSTSVCA